MLYQLKQIGGKLYLQMNQGGILEKLPKLHWWDELKLHFENHFKGSVSATRVRDIIKKYSVYK